MPSQLLFLSTWALMGTTMSHVDHLKDFQVIELRRYTIKEEERDHFASYFESYTPEAFEQMGSLIFGQFLERNNPTGFVWIRGFHDMDARAAVSEAFYGGPLWKEHASTFNDRYRSDGVREAGVLVTLDVPNNFPRLPFRTDGPYLVWLGIVKDDPTLESRFRPLAEGSLRLLSATGLLRGAPELVVLNPTRRSRLRWLPEWQN